MIEQRTEDERPGILFGAVEIAEQTPARFADIAGDVNAATDGRLSGAAVRPIPRTTRTTVAALVLIMGEDQGGLADGADTFRAAADSSQRTSRS